MSYGRPPPDVEGMTSLKVDNLTYRTSPETLRRVFEKYGRVGDVYIPRDRYTKESRGFAFVRFHDNRDAEDAMDAMDGALLDGRELRVQMARYGRPPDSHFGRRGGGGPPRRHGGYGRRSRSRSASPVGADAVVPGAGAAPVAVTTAAPGLVPTLDPVPSPAPPARASPHLDRGPVVLPGPAPAARLPTEAPNPGRGPRAGPSPPRTTELTLSNNSSSPEPLKR